MVLHKTYKGEDIICEYKSANIKKGVYNTVSKMLTITFNNNTSYEYYDVPHEVYAKFNLADSQGKFFTSEIAKKFKYKKI